VPEKIEWRPFEPGRSEEISANVTRFTCVSRREPYDGEERSSKESRG
jgi:hypothetical protein